jgi:hypothetical protein
MEQEYKDVVINCKQCDKSFKIRVPVEGFLRWVGGELIQNALPNLSSEKRELLISHTCPDCWEQLFPEED